MCTQQSTCHIVGVRLGLLNVTEPTSVALSLQTSRLVCYGSSMNLPISYLGHSKKEPMKCMTNSLLIIIIHDSSSPSWYANIKCHRKTDFNYSRCLTLPVYQITHTPLPCKLSRISLSTGEHEQGANYLGSAHQESASKYNHHMPNVQEIRMLFYKARLILCVPCSSRGICSYLFFFTPPNAEDTWQTKT